MDHEGNMLVKVIIIYESLYLLLLPRPTLFISSVELLFFLA